MFVHKCLKEIKSPLQLSLWSFSHKRLSSMDHHQISTVFRLLRTLQ